MNNTTQQFEKISIIKQSDSLKGNIIEKHNSSYSLFHGLNSMKIFFFIVMSLLIVKTKAQDKCQVFGQQYQCLICQKSFGKGSNCTYLGQKISEFSCIDKCCDYVYGKNYTAFENICDGYKSKRLLAIIFPTIAGAILFVICFVCLICACCKKNVTYHQASVNPQNILPQSSLNFIYQQIQENQLPKFQEKKNNAKSFLLNPVEICSICLQKQTEIMTSCKHFFHIDCFGNWLNKNNRCPLCNRFADSFNPVVIYCKKCNYRVIGVKIDKSKGNTLIMMQKYKQTICSACKQ